MAIDYKKLAEKNGGIPVSKEAEIPVEGGYLSRVSSQYKAAGSDIVSGIKSSADQISKGQLQGGLAGIGNQAAGIIRSGLNTVGNVARAAAAPIIEAPGIRQGIDAIGKNVIAPAAETDAGQQILGFAQKHPQAFKDLQNIVDISTLGLGKAAEAPIANAVKAGVSNAENAAVKATSKLKGVFNEANSPTVSLDQAAGEILQGKTGDLGKGIEAIQSIDTKGVKTQKDLYTKLDEKIPELSKVVDSSLSQDTTKTLLDDLVTVKPTKAGGQASVNYVDNALNQLAELYDKTGDVVAKADIEDLINTARTNGLTKLEINDIARTYGSEFGEKAFGKTGEALTSVNAQLFENTRKGIKDLARSGINGDEALKADRLMSSVYNTKNLVKKNMEAVNKLKNRIEERGLLEKIGHGLSKYADILTGGSLRGLIGGLLPRGAGYKVLNALDLEELLQRNLKIIKDAGNAKNTTEFKSIINRLNAPDQSLLKRTLKNSDSQTLAKASPIKDQMTAPSTSGTASNANSIDMSKTVPLKKNTSQGGSIKIGDNLKDKVSKELSNIDVLPLKVNGKVDLSDSDTYFRLSQLQDIVEKRALTNAEVMEALPLLKKAGISIKTKGFAGADILSGGAAAAGAYALNRKARNDRSKNQYPVGNVDRIAKK